MRQKRKLILNNPMLGGAVLIFIALLGWWMSTLRAEEVLLYTVNIEGIQEIVEVRGIVELDREEAVASQIPGVVQEVYVEEGDFVSPGMALAILDPMDYQLSLKKAEKAFAEAHASMEDLKVSIKPETVRQSELQREQAEIACDAAKKAWIYQRERANQVRELYKEGAVSKQYVKDVESLEAAAESAWREAERRLQIAQKSLDLLRKGVPKETLAIARTQVEQAGVQVAEARRMIEKTRIVAGIKGTILTKHIKPGDVVNAGTPLYTVGDTTTAYIRIDLLVDDAENVRVGQRVIITGDVLGDKVMTGTIDEIAPKAENKISSLGIEQQRIKMRILLDMLGVLRPGYGVDVHVVTNERKRAMVVPESAVFAWEGRDHVFVVNHGRIFLRPVTTGLENDEKIQIRRGLKVGDTVVEDPDKKLKEGMRVKAKRYDS